MKNKLFLLTKVNVTAVLSPAKFINAKAGGAKYKKFGYALLFAFLGVYCAFIVGGMTALLYDALSEYKLTLLIPGLFFVAASFVILITCLFTAHGYLFHAKDLDMLFSFPVSHVDILISKFLMLYFYDLMFSALIFGVSGAVYCVLDSAGVMGWLSLIVGIFLTPLLPLAVGVLISYFVGLSLRKVKHRNAVTTVLALAASLVLIYFSSNTNSLIAYIVKYGNNLYEAFKAYYLPAGLLFGAFDGNFVNLLIFIVLNIAPAAILLPVISTRFASIVAAYGSTSAKANYKYRPHKQSSKLRTCFIKEIKRIFASSVYILNAGVGIIMMIILTVSLTQSITEIEGNEASFLNSGIMPLIVMLALIFCCTMNASTGCTFSLEAKTLWIYKSAPVEEMTIFEAKALANEVLYFPFIIIFGVINAVVLNMDFRSSVLVILTPIVALVCSSYFGLLVNLAYPKFKWQNETQVIKQSASVMIEMFASMGFNILIIGLSVLAVIYLNISFFEIILCILVIFLLLMVFLEYRLRTWGVAKFKKLY